MNKDFLKRACKVVIILFLILATQLFSEMFLIPNDLYYIIPWLDIPMHILGGFLFGCLFMFFVEMVSLDYVKINFLKRFEPKLLHLFYFILFVGVTWEIYEYMNDIVNYREWRGVLDSVKDLFDVCLGAFGAYYLLKNK